MGGVRSITGVTVSGIGDIALLVGANGSGKSSFLYGLSLFAIGGARLPVPGRAAAPPGRVAVVGRTELPGARGVLWVDVEFELTAEDRAQVAAGNAWEPFPTVTRLGLRTEVSPDGMPGMVQMRYNGGVVFDGSNWRLPEGTPPQTNASSARSMLCNLGNAVLQRWVLRSIPARRRLEPEPVGPAPTQEGWDGSGLKRRLLKFSMSAPPVRKLLHELEAAFHRVTGETTQILPRQAVGDNLLRVFVQAGVEDQEFDLELSGDGWQELLILLAGVFTADPGTVLAVEEPELHLHPGAQRRLLQVLREEAERRKLQFLIATHSTTLLDHVLVDSVHCFRRGGDGRTGVTTVPVRSPDVFVALGVRRSDACLATGILFVEGPGDAELVRRWGARADVSPEAVGAVIQPIGGKRNAGYYADAESLKALGGELGPLPHAFILDRDERSDEEVAKLGGRGWLVLGRREIENYLLDPAAISRYLACQGKRISPEQVAADIQEVGASLRAYTLLRAISVARGSAPAPGEVLRAASGLNAADDAPLVDSAVRLLGASVHTEEALAAELRARLAETRRWLDARWDRDGATVAAPGKDVLQMLRVRYDVQQLSVRELADEVEPPAEIVAFLRDFCVKCAAG